MRRIQSSKWSGLRLTSTKSFLEVPSSYVTLRLQIWNLPMNRCGIGEGKNFYIRNKTKSVILKGEGEINLMWCE